MCGIAGFRGDFPAHIAGAMGEAIAHRGPDGHGMFRDDGNRLALVHRRLAIVDLSPTGRQPMADSSGRFILCYNGELYNAPELRRELQARGASFRGTSDTEVLVELLARDGPNALARLNGIFAFAWWDRAERRLTLVRDGLGVKPLYLARTRHGIAFASELKALLAVPGLDRTIDRGAAGAYLTYLYSPGERTMFNGVRKLAPGSWLTIGADGKEQSGIFYRLPAPAPTSLDDAEVVAGTRARLDRAVERQMMMADVEVGAFLSGGVDSAAIVALARRHTAKPLQCFTARYERRSDEQSELVEDLPYARRLAAHFGVSLHEVSVDERMIDDFPALIATLDEPEADPAALLSDHIAGLARQHGIKVLLSGTGGDDIFTGYRRHAAARIDGAVALLPRALRDRLATVAARSGGASSSTARRLAKLLSTIGGSRDDRTIARFEWLPAGSAARLLAEPVDVDLIRAPMIAALDALDTSDPVERTLALDQRFFLTDHNLNYTDKTGMAHGVEIRVPLLDPDLVAWAATLPAKAKLRGMTSKWALRQAIAGDVLSETLNRPKTGFGVPLRAWLRGRMRPMLEELTAKPILEQRGLFDPAAVARLRQDTLSGRIDGSYSLLSVMAIELWARRFADAPIPSL
ncbi:MAG: asparagine synthase (glutamine-hydrolyzing) [Sphingomicrobium sp.]